jgi:hypothetical protein
LRALSYLSHDSLIFFVRRSTRPPPLLAMVRGAGRFQKADILLCRSGRRGGSRCLRTSLLCRSDRHGGSRCSRTRGRHGGSGGAREVGCESAVDAVNRRFIFFVFLIPIERRAFRSRVSDLGAMGDAHPHSSPIML